MEDKKVEKFKSGLLGLITSEVIAEVFPTEGFGEETALSGTLLSLHGSTGPAILSSSLTIPHLIKAIARAIERLGR